MRRRGVLLAGLAALIGVGRPAWAEVPKLGFGELYRSVEVTLVFSDRLEALKGQVVRMSGYMAPPLTADAGFFVLTREPMSVCPFCSTASEWPSDIVVIYLKPGTGFAPTDRAIGVSGRLELGPWRDPISGFVSLIRLREAEWQRQ